MSNNILVIDSSARTQGSYSRMLVQEFVDLLQANGGPHPLTRRDLALQPLPVLQPGVVEAIRTRPEELSDEQHQLAALSETLIDELRAADLIVIGAPMYNWGVAAALKAWIDQVVRIGFTFTYGANGPEGLLKNKQTLVIATRGGVYSDPARSALDFQQPYLRHVLGVIGLQPEFVVCEAMLGKPEARDANLAAARAALAEAAKRFG